MSYATAARRNPFPRQFWNPEPYVIESLAPSTISGSKRPVVD
jgi:hypothetical protein